MVCYVFSHSLQLAVLFVWSKEAYYGRNMRLFDIDSSRFAAKVNGPCAICHHQIVDGLRYSTIGGYAKFQVSIVLEMVNNWSHYNHLVVMAILN